jgi:hypothetical protein
MSIQDKKNDAPTPIELSRELASFVGVVNPGTLPKYIADQESRQVDVLRSLQRKIAERTAREANPGVRPLTPEEAEEADRQIGILRGEIQKTRDRIVDISLWIDSLAGETASGGEIVFKINPKKLMLKKAVEAVFGEGVREITYSMYKAALEARRALQKQESADYVNGSWIEGK